MYRSKLSFVVKTNITVLTSTTVAEIVGQPGEFEVTLNKNGQTEKLATKIGSIVQATGWKPYDASKLGHLGYGKFKDEVTNVELEQLAGSGNWQ